jgi:hypothetical protein
LIAEKTIKIFSLKGIFIAGNELKDLLKWYHEQECDLESIITDGHFISGIVQDMFHGERSIYPSYSGQCLTLETGFTPLTVYITRWCIIVVTNGEYNKARLQANYFKQMSEAEKPEPPIRSDLINGMPINPVLGCMTLEETTAKEDQLNVDQP